MISSHSAIKEVCANEDWVKFVGLLLENIHRNYSHSYFLCILDLKINWTSIRTITKTVVTNSCLLWINPNWIKSWRRSYMKFWKLFHALLFKKKHLKKIHTCILIYALNEMYFVTLKHLRYTAVKEWFACLPTDEKYMIIKILSDKFRKQIYLTFLTLHNFC